MVPSGKCYFRLPPFLAAFLGAAFLAAFFGAAFFAAAFFGAGAAARLVLIFGAGALPRAMSLKPLSAVTLAGA
jgi:hypothetical protein